MDEKKDLPVAVIDSGVGGTSVLAALVKQMPHERFLYFGDSQNAPYGEKSREQVLKITRQNLKMLQAVGIKALVIACNTATGAAAATLREENPALPIIGIEPALKPASLIGERPRILVMATPLTLIQEKFRTLAAGISEKAEIIPLPCPGLVGLIERGILEGEELDSLLDSLFFPYRSTTIDAVVLGCTHYPHIRERIMAHLPSGIPIFDGGEGTARQTERRLAEKQLLRKRGDGSVSFQSSTAGGEVLAERLFRRLL